MNKSIKKWIKRLLLWVIGFPVALIVGLFLLLEIANSIAPELFDEKFLPVLKHVLKVDIYDEQEHDLNLITTQFNRKNYAWCATALKDVRRCSRQTFTFFMPQPIKCKNNIRRRSFS